MEKTIINNPLVSIFVPAYNCEAYIQQTLNCLMAQTYENIEIIVVNDGSTDDTADKIAAITDKRILLINTINGGASTARNVAYRASHGQFVIFFDADDFVEPGFVQQQLDRINGQKDIVVLSAWGRFYNDDPGSFVKEPLPYDELSFEEWIDIYWRNCNPMTNPGRVIIPRAIVEASGLWNETLSLNDDLEFYTRIFLQSKKILFNHNAVFYYRSGIGGLSSRKSDEAFRSLYKSIKISTELVLKRYEGNPAIRQSCANFWQNLIYEVYPKHNEIEKAAKENLLQLGGAKFPYPAGGYTKALSTLVGWKLTKLLKIALRGY